MKTLLFGLLLLLASYRVYEEPVKPIVKVVATIKLADGTKIVNAPSGRSWTDYQAIGVDTYEASDTMIIDDSDINQITYVGNWSVSKKNITVPDNSGCNCSFSNKKGDHIIFKFTNATQVAWIGEAMHHHGIAKVYLDNQLQATIDTYDTANIHTVTHWQKNDLDTAKIYTLKVEVTGQKNAASDGTYVVHQYFRLIKAFEATDPVDSPVEIKIVRKGRYKIFINGIQDDGEHNEYEKAIEHAINSKVLNPDKEVTIESPTRVVNIK